MDTETAYEVFGLSKDAVYSEADIRKIYRKLCLRYHPDRQECHPDRQECHPDTESRRQLGSIRAHSYFILVNKAYSIVTIHNNRIKHLFSSGIPQVDSGITDIILNFYEKSPTEITAKFDEILKIYKEHTESSFQV